MNWGGGAEEARAWFQAWLPLFAAALESRDADAVARCFADDSSWKDILAFTWTFPTFTGKQEIQSALTSALVQVEPHGVRVAEDRTAPRFVSRAKRMTLEGFVDFSTQVGSGTAFVRLVQEEGQPRIWMLLTTLQSLDGHEERIGDNRPTGKEYSFSFAGDNWLDTQRKRQEFADEDPDVLIVGAGHSGLMLAARLEQMGVSNLIVERTPRVGDVWRNRYHSLTLHNPVWANDLPYMPFPETWPMFVPKDKLADWLDYYAKAMELRIWTSTEFTGGEYDEDAGAWTVSVTRGDGTDRVLRPRHLVLAVGVVSGTPNMPELPGLEDFSNEVVHSGAFSSGHDYRGKDAIVVGTGTSGHDVAQDLYENGAANVTMVQRSPTCVVSIDPSATMVYSIYDEGPPPEDIDLVTAAAPFGVLKETYQHVTRRTSKLDQDLLQRLEAVGFRTWSGHDDTGFHMMYLRRGGGYYINVGCSELIADGEIGLVQYDDIDRFVPGGLRLADGDEVQADLVVLATGYENLQTGIRQLLGDEVARRVGDVWGFDEDHNLKNVWQPTGQPGFWVMGGGLLEARPNSRYLALQLIAELEDLDIPSPVRLDAGEMVGAA